MLKKSALGILIALLCATPSIGGAQSVSDLLALLAQLQAQVQALQSQVLELRQELGVSPSSAPTYTESVAPPAALPIIFVRPLVAGSSGDDVRRLQEFLAKDESIYPEGLITGYFGPLTERAVRRWQEQNGIPPVGRVGPLTIAKLTEAVRAEPIQPITFSMMQSFEGRGGTPTPATAPSLSPHATTTTSTPPLSPLNSASTATSSVAATITSTATYTVLDSAVQNAAPSPLSDSGSSPLNTAGSGTAGNTPTSTATPSINTAPTSTAPVATSTATSTSATPTQASLDPVFANPSSVSWPDGFPRVTVSAGVSTLFNLALVKIAWTITSGSNPNLDGMTATVTVDGNPYWSASYAAATPNPYTVEYAYELGAAYHTVITNLIDKTGNTSNYAFSFAKTVDSWNTPTISFISDNLVTIAAPATPPAPPIGYWKFDGSGDNEIAGSPAAVAIGNAVFNANGGKFGGYAYIPSGSDYVKVPYNSVFDLPESFSIEFWFRQRADQTFLQNLVHKGTPPNNYNFYIFRQLWNQYNFGPIITGYTAAATGYWTQTSNPNQLSHNTWHHVAFVKSPTERAYYLDGLLVHFGTDSPAAKTPANDIIIGNSAVDTDIDNLKIYDRSLSAAEVQSAAAVVSRDVESVGEQLAHITRAFSILLEGMQKLLGR